MKSEKLGRSVGKLSAKGNLLDQGTHLATGRSSEIAHFKPCDDKRGR